MDRARADESSWHEHQKGSVRDEDLRKRGEGENGNGFQLFS